MLVTQLPLSAAATLIISFINRANKKTKAKHNCSSGCGADYFY